jgi:histidine triad (HIT) family protein
MHDSIFTKIIKREIPAEIIYEDDYSIVIPDIMPTMRGQLIVATKRQEGYVFNLSDEEYGALMKTTKKIARALDTAFVTVRTCIVIEGFEVPHVHVRMYPCTTNELAWGPRYTASNTELEEVAEAVRAALKG